MLVIPDKAWIILPEDGMADVGEQAYQIALFQSCPELFFLNPGPALAAGAHDDYDHGETSVDLSSAEKARASARWDFTPAKHCSATSNRAVRADLPWLLS